MRKIYNKILLPLLLTLPLVSCGTSQQLGDQNVANEQETVQTGFLKLSQSQQIPAFEWSQERQTLIDIETIRATGATTTSAGYLDGVGLIWWCPSIGTSVPSTYQLSGGTQYVDLPDDGSYDKHPVDQGEPTGVYVGSSSNTWVLCVDDNGNKLAKGWEGNVEVTSGIVDTYPPDKRAVVKDITFKFTEQKKK